MRYVIRLVALICCALVAPVAFLFPVPEASSRQPGESPAFLAETNPREPRAHEWLARVAQRLAPPSLEVIQVLLVEPGTDVPLSVQVKSGGALPQQSFIRIRGLPPATSLSVGQLVRPGEWTVPLSALRTVRITVPVGQSGRSELTISLVTADNTIIAETRTTLVVGTASLLPIKPSPPTVAAPAKDLKAPRPKLDGPEVTLRMKVGGFELKGRLKGYDGARYVIDNEKFGTMTLDATNMECIGAGCPGTETKTATDATPPVAVPQPPSMPRDRRVALVIGNSAYQHTRSLPNPINDAEAIAKLLRENGFTDATPKRDLNYRAMRDELRVFAEAARGADIAVVYYAGHGLELAGENYLIPIDAKLIRDIDLEFEAVTLALILDVVSGARKLKLVILDACRNNPLGERIMLSSGVTRSFRGLARIEPKGEVLVAYAAKAGKLALDGVGRHSPYAEALLKHMATPGLDVLRMFGRVKETVLKATQGGQEPWIYGSPGGEAIALVPGLVVPPHPVTRQERVAEARQAFQDAKGSEQRLAAVAERYKDTVYSDYARQEIKGLQDERKKMAHAVPPVAPVPPAALKAGSVFRDCPDCPEMVVVPSGSFMMGSPENGPQRRVTITRPFAVGKFEVTFDEWEACVAAIGCTSNPRPSDSDWGRGRRPVINVSWHDAKAYAAWLSAKTGRTYRLLSEAEWEYAARAGTTTLYAFGDAISKSQAQYAAPRSVEVGSFPANTFGVHDMHGNVREWVEDAWHPNYQGAPNDGSVWLGGDTSRRVLRGGSYVDNPYLLRSTIRATVQPEARYSDIGFRVAKTP